MQNSNIEKIATHVLYMYNTCMTQLTENIHLLLGKHDLSALKRRAKKEHVSVAELIRRAIRRVYDLNDPDEKREAFARLQNKNELQVEDWDEMKKDLLNRYE